MSEIVATMLRKKILLIDDEEDIREVAALSLETIGDFEVLAAAGGAEGFELAVRELPDAILLDVMMPGLDGPATLERLRSNESTRGIPVIFLTAKVQSSDRKRLADLGARAIIGKPFDPESLAATVEEILEG